MDIFDLSDMLAPDLKELKFMFEIAELDSDTPCLKIWTPRAGHKEDSAGFCLTLEQLTKLFKLWFKTGGYVIHPDNKTVRDQTWLNLYMALKEVFEGDL